MAGSSEQIPPPALALFGVVSGPHSGTQIPVSVPVVSIGQGPQNDIVLDDDSVSRAHARLEFNSGAWQLTDLESTNGTAIEGAPLVAGVPTALDYGAAVRFGAVRMQFHEVEAADPAAARASFRETVPTSPAPGRRFRLPLWLALLILVLIAVAVAIFLSAGGADAAVALTPAPWTIAQTVGPAGGP